MCDCSQCMDYNLTDPRADLAPEPVLRFPLSGIRAAVILDNMLGGFGPDGEPAEDDISDPERLAAFLADAFWAGAGPGSEGADAVHWEAATEAATALLVAIGVKPTVTEC